MKIGVVIFWAIFMTAAAVRVWLSFGYKAPDIGSCVSENVSGTGIITDEPERKEAGQVFIVNVENMDTVPMIAKPVKNKTASGTVVSLAEKADAVAASASISIPASTPWSSSSVCSTDFLLRMKTKLYPQFKFGDEVSFGGKISDPRNFGEAGGRTFDYVGYLAKDDVYYEIKSAVVRSEDSASTILASASTTPFFGMIRSIPEKISETLFSFRRRFIYSLSYSLGEPYAALAAGLVLGEKSALGNSLVDDFRTVGLIHIVILSGYSVTLIGFYIRKSLSFLPRNWAIVLGGIATFLFCLMVGGAATVMRASLMAEIVLVSELMRRDYNIIRSLLFVILVMVIISPMILFNDVSFQISILATLGLILLSKPVKSFLKFIPEKYELRSIVTSTVSTQIFVTPFILYMMGQLSLVSVVANILVLPLIPLTMLSVFLTGGLGFISLAAARIAGLAAHFLLAYIIFIVESFAGFSFAALRFPPFSVWWVWGFYAVAVSFLVWWRRGSAMNDSWKP